MCMAEGNTSHGVTESDIISMKEALHAQQHLLQKLYAELDEEREASSTAASEALSMILRLQGEKAAVHMESSQYKRLAEEKICHAEESMAIFEDIIYQKEMEIASLEFQIQAYKCKLLSLGCTDLGGASENRFPESLLLQGSNLCNGETAGNIRRLSSLPPILLKDSQQKKSITEKESSTVSITDMVPKEMDLEVNVQSLNTEKKSGNSAGGNFNTYWEQIKMLDERVKEISSSKSAERDKSIIKSASRICSLPLQESISKPCDPTRPEIITCLDKEKDNYHQQEEDNASTSCSSNVHDIFEVPQIDDILITREHRKRQESKVASDVEDRLGKPDLVAHDTDELSYKDDADCLKKMLLSTNQESKLCKPRESVDCNVAHVCPKIGVAADSQALFQHLSKRIDRLEGERIRTRHEISYAADEEKQLLREIREQLNVIQAEIHSLRPRKSPPQDDQPLISLMEACNATLLALTKQMNWKNDSQR
ncbi:hypothetical protein FEM48_Zijuj01G0169000 [Ziziphus jujuba var. spinosa]|uniref:GTD-binding domain-containing protein n=1 Tax=Ziziphus jujuba var. spinosa TaxID=714518 RepID=A0A978W2F6_ZIZJJ|nr:hypothetical protein FEM48_Zijuj01G0169000 [Ziziphus jujuba var. spinosa]